MSIVIVNTACKWLKYIGFNEDILHLATDSVDNIVDLQDGAHALGGQGDGAGGDEQRLNDVLLQDVGDATFSHVNSGGLLSLQIV